MSIEDVRKKVESEIRLLEEFVNELKWLDRGLKGEKGTSVDPKTIRDRALLALERLKDAKYSELLKKYGVTLPAPEDITKNY